LFTRCRAVRPKILGILPLDKLAVLWYNYAMDYEPLKCPKCNRPEPICTRRAGIRRKYLCPDCRFTFRTIEQVEVAAESQAFQMWLRGFLKGEESNGSAD
jgi:transposase-like protein